MQFWEFYCDCKVKSTRKWEVGVYDSSKLLCAIKIYSCFHYPTFFFPWEWDNKKNSHAQGRQYQLMLQRPLLLCVKGGRTRILNSIFHIIPIWFITEQLHHHIHKLFKDKFLILSYLLQNNLGQLCKGKT